MKYIILFALVSVMLCQKIVAQDSVFTANQGLAAAQEKAIESGYSISHLVSIHMIWNMEEGTYKVFEPYIDDKFWNGFSKIWEYTFFHVPDSSYHTFRIIGSTAGLIAEKANSPENLDTVAIPSGWMDSDDFAEKAYNYSIAGSRIQLSFNKYSFSVERLDTLSWKITNDDAIIVLNAFTGERIFGGVVGISDLNINNEKTKLYPNPSSSDIILQYELAPEFSRIDIITRLGESIGSLPVSLHKTKTIIPIHLFPSNGQYFVRLSGRKVVVVPITISR